MEILRPKRRIYLCQKYFDNDLLLLYEFPSLPITTRYRILTHLRYIAVENNVRKGEIACNKQFLLFSQCFLP